MVLVMNKEFLDIDNINSNYKKLTPFEFFNLKVSFDIDEQELRSKYFYVCKYFRDKNDDILIKTHENYRILNDKIKRIDLILNLFGVNISNNIESVPGLILKLNNELLDLNYEPNSFKQNIEELINNNESELQSLIEQLKTDEVLNVRNLLKYLYNMLNKVK